MTTIVRDVYLAQFCQPCPHCGGALYWIERDPESVDSELMVHCPTDYEIDHDWDMSNLFDEDGRLIGWSLDGTFINGCEGAVTA